MELFKERLADSLVAIMVIFFLIAIVMVLADIYWPLTLFMGILLFGLLVKWIHWQFIEPFAKEKKKSLDK